MHTPNALVKILFRFPRQWEFQWYCIPHFRRHPRMEIWMSNLGLTRKWDDNKPAYPSKNREMHYWIDSEWQELVGSSDLKFWPHLWYGPFAEPGYPSNQTYAYKQLGGLQNHQNGRQKHIVKNHTNCTPAKFYCNSRTKFHIQDNSQKKNIVVIVVAEHGPSKIGTLPVAPWPPNHHDATTLRAATGHLPGTTRHRRQVGRPVAPGAGHRGHGFHQHKLKHGDIWWPEMWRNLRILTF